jgi:hypothetical protein
VLKCVLAVAVLALITARPSHSLERRLGLYNDDFGDEWNAGATCVVQYYNACTGWVWVWEPVGPSARFGTLIEPCCETEEGHLVSTSSLVLFNGGCGRGFTGSIAIYAADAQGCPSGPALASKPVCPNEWSWFTTTWNLDVPSPFILVLQGTSQYSFGQFAPATDHPSAGPTGPQACGVCFPEDRPNRSFFLGTAAEPLCPGEPYYDGVCNAEILTVASFSCTTHVDDSSWGKVKTLYR